MYLMFACFRLVRDVRCLVLGVGEGFGAGCRGGVWCWVWGRGLVLGVGEEFSELSSHCKPDLNIVLCRTKGM